MTIYRIEKTYEKSSHTKTLIVASGAPTVNNDLKHNYDVGSRWYDTILRIWYVCSDSTNTAAVWDVDGAPSMTTSERNGLQDPPAGMMVFNSTTKTLNIFNGTTWNPIFDDSYITLEEKWLQRPQLCGDIANTNANKDFKLTGQGALSAHVCFAENGIKLTTCQSANDQMILAPQIDEQTLWDKCGLWGSENSIQFEAWFKTDSDISDTTIWAGFILTHASDTGTDDNQVKFRYCTNDGPNLTLVTSRSGVDVITNLGIPVTVDSLYRVRFEVASDRTLRAWVNGAEISLGTGATALVTGIDLKPNIGLETTTTAQKHLYVLPGLKCARLAS